MTTSDTATLQRASHSRGKTSSPYSRGEETGTDTDLQHDFWFASFARSPVLWLLIAGLSVVSALTTGIALSAFLNENATLGSELTNNILAIFLTVVFQTSVVLLTIRFATQIQNLLFSFVRGLAPGDPKPRPSRNHSGTIRNWVGRVTRSVMSAALFGTILMVPLACSIAFSYMTFHQLFERNDVVIEDSLRSVSASYDSAYRAVENAIKTERRKAANELVRDIGGDIGNQFENFSVYMQHVLDPAARSDNTPDFNIELANTEAAINDLVERGSNAMYASKQANDRLIELQTRLEGKLQQRKKTETSIARSIQSVKDYALLFSFEFNGCPLDQFTDDEIEFPPDSKPLATYEGAQPGRFTFYDTRIKREILVSHLTDDRKGAEIKCNLELSDERHKHFLKAIRSADGDQIRTTLLDTPEKASEYLPKFEEDKGADFKFFCQPSPPGTHNNNRAGCLYRQYQRNASIANQDFTNLHAIKVEIEQIEEDIFSAERELTRLENRAAQYILGRASRVDNESDFANALQRALLTPSEIAILVDEHIFDIASNILSNLQQVEFLLDDPADTLSQQLRRMQNQLRNINKDCNTLRSLFIDDFKASTANFPLKCNLFVINETAVNQVVSLEKQLFELSTCGPLQAPKAKEKDNPAGVQTVRLQGSVWQADSAVLSNFQYAAPYDFGGSPLVTTTTRDTNPLFSAEKQSRSEPKTSLELNREQALEERLKLFTNTENVLCLQRAADATGVFNSPVNGKKVREAIQKYNQDARTQGNKKTAWRSITLLRAEYFDDSGNNEVQGGKVDVQYSFAFAMMIDVMILILGLLVSIEDTTAQRMQPNPVRNTVRRVFENHPLALMDVMNTVTYDPSQPENWRMDLDLRALKSRTSRPVATHLAGLAASDTWIVPDDPDRIRMSSRLFLAMQEMKNSLIEQDR